MLTPMEVQAALAVFAAASGMAMALAPLLQAVRAVKLRRADDVSAGWLAVVVVGASAWAAYGVSLGNWAMIIPNIVGVMVTGGTLLVVLAVRRGVGQPAAP